MSGRPRHIGGNVARQISPFCTAQLAVAAGYCNRAERRIRRAPELRGCHGSDDNRAYGHIRTAGGLNGTRRDPAGELPPVSECLDSGGRCRLPRQARWRSGVDATPRLRRAGGANRVACVVQDSRQFTVEFGEGVAQRVLQPWIRAGTEVTSEAEDCPSRKVADAVAREQEPEHEEPRAEHHRNAAVVDSCRVPQRRAHLLSTKRSACRKCYGAGLNHTAAAGPTDTSRRGAALGGFIRRLHFGGLVLLQPELLDAHASGMVQAAREEPDGLGFIAEDEALAGRFRLAESERVSDKAQEKLLLIADRNCGRVAAARDRVEREH